ncbi:MAG: hypothetical protein E7E23_23545, partial [Paenibacillus sp.]|uniref:hypothetical protein n=1 Tax=Paenibacillus sp. TaxID=58172 RepID=UPI002904914D
MLGFIVMTRAIVPRMTTFLSLNFIGLNSSLEPGIGIGEAMIPRSNTDEKPGKFQSRRAGRLPPWEKGWCRKSSLRIMEFN